MIEISFCDVKRFSGLKLNYNGSVPEDCEWSLVFSSITERLWIIQNDNLIDKVIIIVNPITHRNEVSVTIVRIYKDEPTEILMKMYSLRHVSEKQIVKKINESLRVFNVF